MKKTILIEGMMCNHCVMHAKKALEAVEGVTEAVVELSTKSATLTLSKAVDDAVLKAAVEDAGYEVTDIR